MGLDALSGQTVPGLSGLVGHPLSLGESLGGMKNPPRHVPRHHTHAEMERRTLKANVLHFIHIYSMYFSV